ncbi:diguanylate cyclase (GGDEF)-like protein/PAS domain S-box-containing protein [Paraburkholderia sp. GAS334]
MEPSSDSPSGQQPASFTDSPDATRTSIPRQDGPLSSMVLAASLACLLCLGSATLKAMSGEIVPIWMANGALLAQTLAAKRPRRYFVLLGGTLGFLGANLWQGESLYVTCSFTGVDMLEIGVALLFAPRVSTASELIQPGPCVRFVAAAVLLAPTLSGVVAMCLLEGWFSTHSFSSLRDWAISDGLGMAIFTPAALVFFSGELRQLWQSNRRNRTFALLALVGLVTALVFSQVLYRSMYWILPPIALLALEADLAGVFIGVLLCIAIALALTMHGTGPLWMPPYRTSHERILSLQLFVLAALGIAFPIHALQAQRQRLLDLLRDSERRYRTLAENSDDVVMQLSLNGTIKYVSPRAKLKLGYMPHELIGTGVVDLVHPGDRSAVERAIDTVQQEKSEAAIRYRTRRSDGTYIWVQSFLSAVLEIPEHAFDALAFTIRDINAKMLEDQRRDAMHLELERLAYVDGLSGLYNRRHFDIELERCLSSHSPSSQSATVVLLLVDIDNFKTYNDCHGHQAGDDCLRRVASAIALSVPSTGVTARYGGEEFGIILAASGQSEAQVIAERVRTSVEALAIPHATSSGGIVTVSVGLAAAASGTGVSVRKLVAEADSALYQAKRLGRNQTASHGQTAH